MSTLRLASLFRKNPESVDKSTLLEPDEKVEARSEMYFEDQKDGESYAMFFIRDLDYSRNQIFKLNIATDKAVKDELHSFFAEMDEFFKRLDSHLHDIKSSQSQVRLDQAKMIGEKICALKRSAHYMLEVKLTSTTLDDADKKALKEYQQNIISTCLNSLKSLNMIEDKKKAEMLDKMEEQIAYRKQ